MSEKTPDESDRVRSAPREGTPEGEERASPARSPAARRSEALEAELAALEAMLARPAEPAGDEPPEPPDPEAAPEPDPEDAD